MKPIKLSDHKPKRYIALARVSSREQAREGFSLDVQEKAVRDYAERQGGVISKLYRIAETASKTDERKTFKEMMSYARANADKLTGMLFYKIDRAARNLPDYVELEKLESDHGVRFISISQPTENTPAGRMQRRIFASMASFYTEQQGLDVSEGLAKRVESGFFPSRPPVGYRNVRNDGRSVVEVDDPQASKIQVIFELYAHQNCTIDMIVERLGALGIAYTDANPAWPRSKVGKILRDRSYIGEIFFRGQWHRGKQPPIIDRVIWNRVQALLGEGAYQAHQMTYAGGLIRCGCCGLPVTGESVVKRETGKEYIYYRCSRYNRPGHPRIRLTEKQLDEQVVTLLGRIRQTEEVRDWFGRMLRLWSDDQQRGAREKTKDIQRQLSSVREQEDRLLNLRLLEEIDADTYAAKKTEMRDRIAQLTLLLESADRGRAEQADKAARVFELSQTLKDRWMEADFSEKREILELLCLNFKLDGATLVPEMRSPFDLLVEGLDVSLSRGDKI